MVHGMRQKAQKAFVKLVFDPGEAMQIDWGTFQAYLQGEPVRLYYFCARLCYSCAPFVMCFRRQNTEAFLEAQVHAFEFFGGVPRRVIFDNAKVAVKSGYGKTAIAQDKYKALAAHYCFEMDFCNPASGNEKGLVENLVGWTRRNIFVPVPHVTSLKDLNQHVLTRCRTYAEPTLRNTVLPAVSSPSMSFCRWKKLPLFVCRTVPSMPASVFHAA